MIVEEHGTRTERRRLRSDVRAAIGTSSDGAPNALQALRAAHALRAVLRMASNGRFRLTVVDVRSGEMMDTSDALRRAREEGLA